MMKKLFVLAAALFSVIAASPGVALACPQCAGRAARRVGADGGARGVRLPAVRDRGAGLPLHSIGGAGGRREDAFSASDLTEHKAHHGTRRALE
jgi:hypothetical protein